MLLSKCAVCDSKKSIFIKEKEASGLLISLEVKALLISIRLAGLFCFRDINKLIQDIKWIK